MQCTHVAVLCVLLDCQQGKLTQKYKDNSEVCVPVLPGIQHSLLVSSKSVHFVCGISLPF